MADSDDTTELTLLLAEYSQIKDEQRARIGFRDNLLYVTIGAVTAVTAVALQTSHPDLALALPVVCVVLGWTYLVNDEKISAIGRYIRTELASRLSTLSGPAAASAFGWETYHRGDSRRASRKITQAVVDLTAFVAVPFAALTVFWLYGTASALLISSSILEAVMLAVLGGQFLWYAER
ncbi:hypothetical protein GCM10011583_65010 [Streptomyces camponoticapitis]|uniref:Integral membrane protein n=1 Tax=Streptomyces camponoticapitis TaxID=1616125 RepID=A0ABQ2ESV7_9ACTN|nr:hypothetical protein [Streptomyces camponoticapitis]GGK24059.1 hypothetical protein GCM10011583_65010 [Streptomyces camponoticapitis]